MKVIYSFLMILVILHATGDPILKIKLKPIAVGSHGHVLFSTYKYANAFGSSSYNKQEFGWLVVYGRTGEWDERKAYHFEGKNKEDVLYQKYLQGKVGLKNPDKVLKKMMDKYFFTATSSLRESSSVYEIKANQSCFDSECVERTSIQKTLGEKESKVFHASIRSSFYFNGVALFHNTSNKGAVFDFNQEVYVSSNDAYPKLYPYSNVDGLVLFDPFLFKLNTKINLPKIRKQIAHCKSKKSKHETFKRHNAQWDICQATQHMKIISIEYEVNETKKKRYTEHKEMYVVNRGKLEYAFEQQSDSRKGHQWIWNCQFAIINEKEAEVLTSLGHGKTEDENWDTNEIIEMYKKRMHQLKDK